MKFITISGLLLIKQKDDKNKTIAKKKTYEYEGY